MFDSVWMVFIDWRLEVYAALVLGFLTFLRWRYRNNQLVAAYIQSAVNAVATRMEQTAPKEIGVGSDPPHGKRQVLRRKIRRDIGSKARRVNRGKK